MGDVTIDGARYELSKGERRIIARYSEGRRPAISVRAEDPAAPTTRQIRILVARASAYLGIDSSLLRYREIRQSSSYTYLIFDQYVGEAKIWDSVVRVRTTKAGDMVSFGGAPTPSFRHLGQGGVTRGDAVMTARDHLNLEGGGETESTELVYYPPSHPQPKADVFEWHVIVLDTRGGRWLVEINAETQSVTSEKVERAMADVDGERNSSGSGAPSPIVTDLTSQYRILSFAGGLSGSFDFDEKDEPQSSETKTPLEYAYVEIEWLRLINPPKLGSVARTCEAPSTCTARTDANGDFSFTNLDEGVYELTARAETNWSKPLLDAQDDEYVVEVEVPGPGTTTKDLYWNVITPTADREHFGNLAHAMEEMHDYFKATPLGYTGWDSQMTYSAGGSGALKCKATASGTDVRAGIEMQQSKEIIYHEYTHNVIYEIYAGFIGSGVTEGSAMDEGLSDYFAGSKSSDSELGEDISCPGERNLVNSLKMSDWPVGTNQGNGLIIGGAVWDLRPGERYASSGTSDSEVDKTLYEALQALPTTFIDLGLEMEDYHLAGNPNNPIIAAINDSWDYREMSLDGHHKSDGSEQKDVALPAGNFGVDIFPNPAPGGIFNVSVRGDADSHASISLFDILGRMVVSLYEGPMRDGIRTFEISRIDLPPGMYAITVSTQSRTYGKSFIVQ